MSEKMVIVSFDSEPRPVLMTPSQIRLMEWLQNNDYLADCVTYSVQDSEIESI